jgi:hypothetical protein
LLLDRRAAFGVVQNTLAVYAQLAFPVAQPGRNPAFAALEEASTAIPTAAADQ